MLLEYDRFNPVIGVNLPLKEMNRTGSDVSITIIWLNSVTHSKPNSDPLFSAHERFDFEGITLNSLLYRSDHVVGVVGCAIQVCASLVIVSVADKSHSFLSRAMYISRSQVTETNLTRSTNSVTRVKAEMITVHRSVG